MGKRTPDYPFRLTALGVPAIIPTMEHDKTRRNQKDLTVTRTLDTSSGSSQPVDTSESIGPWRPGDLLLDEFTVEGVLGRGGMGAVFLAKRRVDDALFAVKTLLESQTSIPSRRRAFLRELRTWIDLPEHPNLTACRFFRTIDNRLAIFAEYVEAGSLREWIINKKVNDLATALDLAIQFAWGLQAAHVNGVVHQDVKPSNVLMTASGVVKVTDFGLAKARASGPQILTNTEKGETVMVSSGGMTAAYCSPEQAAQGKLSRKTDIFSWGVSILEMFLGELTWSFGPTAELALIRHNQQSSGLEAVPISARLQELIHLCLHEDPAKRPVNMEQVATELIEIYRTDLGRDYPRPKPVFERIEDKKVELVRNTAVMLHWQPPEHHLEIAFELAGKDPAEVQLLIPAPEGSRKAQALADLEMYGEAEFLLMSLTKKGSMEARKYLTLMLNEKATIHRSLGDHSGILSAYDKSLVHSKAYLEEINDERMWDLLASTLLNKGIALSEQGDSAGSIKFYDRAGKIWKRLYKNNRIDMYGGSLALVNMNKGQTHQILGDYETSLELYRTAIEYLQMMDKADPMQPENALGYCYVNLSISLLRMGKLKDAQDAVDRAISIRECLVNKSDNLSISHILAETYKIKGEVLLEQKKAHEALSWIDKGLDIIEDIVSKKDRDDLAQESVDINLAKVRVLKSLGKNTEALDLADSTILFADDLVYKQNRWILLPLLLNLQLFRAELLIAAGNSTAAHDGLISVENCILNETKVSQDHSWNGLLQHARALLKVTSDQSS